MIFLPSFYKIISIEVLMVEGTISQIDIYIQETPTELRIAIIITVARRLLLYEPIYVHTVGDHRVQQI